MFSPLLFVNWEKVGHIFCAIMWGVVVVLLLVILLSHTPATPMHGPHAHGIHS